MLHRCNTAMAKTKQCVGLAGLLATTSVSLPHCARKERPVQQEFPAEIGNRLAGLSSVAAGWLLRTLVRPGLPGHCSARRCPDCGHGVRPTFPGISFLIPAVLPGLPKHPGRSPGLKSFASIGTGSVPSDCEKCSLRTPNICNTLPPRQAFGPLYKTVWPVIIEGLCRCIYGNAVCIRTHRQAGRIPKIRSLRQQNGPYRQTRHFGRPNTPANTAHGRSGLSAALSLRGTIDVAVHGVKTAIGGLG